MLINTTSNACNICLYKQASKQLYLFKKQKHTKLSIQNNTCISLHIFFTLQIAYYKISFIKATITSWFKHKQAMVILIEKHEMNDN